MILTGIVPRSAGNGGVFSLLGLQPTVFYRWQKEFFENGAAAFEQKMPSNHSAEHAELDRKLEVPESSARFVVRRPREERRATFIVADETHNFRIATIRAQSE